MMSGYELGWHAHCASIMKTRIATKFYFLEGAMVISEKRREQRKRQEKPACRETIKNP